MNRRGFFGALFGAAAAPAVARALPAGLLNVGDIVSFAGVFAVNPPKTQMTGGLRFHPHAFALVSPKIGSKIGTTIYFRKPPRFRNADGSTLVFAGSGRERP